LHAVDAPRFPGYSFFAVHIGPAVLDQRKAPSGPSRNPVVIPSVALANPALSSQLMAAHETWANGAGAWEKHAVLQSLIDGLASCDLRFESRAPDRAGVHSRAIDEALAYLRERYADEVSLTELAAMARLSRFHFLRVFSSALGVTPRQFQLLLRVARAKELLRGKCEIAEVALLTGFFDQSHLTRCFHHIVGVTPGDYRLGLAMRADHGGATSCKTRRGAGGKNGNDRDAGRIEAD
jgi:AraC-like DNA-binding protein